MGRFMCRQGRHRGGQRSRKGVEESENKAKAVMDAVIRAKEVDSE
jgi:hypothetical protein